MRKLLLYPFALLLLLTAGCSTGTLPDPNDPSDVGVLSPETVRRNLYWANAMLMDRERLREITPAQSREFIARRAKELLGNLDLGKVKPEDAWEYGEIFMTAKEWKGAKKFLEQAVSSAKNEDRRVNDTLRLAQVDARLGDVKTALTLARTTLNVPDVDGAPVLPGIYLDIAPVAQGHGLDMELAQLVLDAIAVHKRVKVDEKSDSGRAFIVARQHHIFRAYKLAAALYNNANRPDLAKKIADQWRAESVGKDPVI